MMKQQTLPKSFFRENPLEEMSAALIAHFSIMVGLDDELEHEILEHTVKEIAPERLEKIEREKSSITQVDDAEQLVKLMRGNFDIANRSTICRKALAMQETVMPLLLKRLQTSFQDLFIECCIPILAVADLPYIEQLKAMYLEICNPYAQSMVCLVFGMQDCQDTIPLLLAEYHRMQRDYPEESFAQGPLLALYILHGRA